MREKGGVNITTVISVFINLSKIFLIIIIFLLVALGVSSYYWIYYRNAYFSAANEMVRIVEEKNSNNQ